MTEIEEQEDRLIKEAVPMKSWLVTRSLGAGGSAPLISMMHMHGRHGVLGCISGVNVDQGCWPA